MKSGEIRALFLEHFRSKDHQIVPSASLVPTGDSTLLFTNAGMVPFKDIFTGKQSSSFHRATSSQKCVRAGGKHNDLDEVGKTARHHTFFEMLGNFSFGDYFKRQAIEWAWEFLIEKLSLDPARLIITVYGGDDSLPVPPDEEARQIWKQTTQFSSDRIIGLGKSENFWMMGETGPMGPCSEIHYWVGEGPPKLPPADPSHPLWESWLEVWNLVFMQYERKVAGGSLDPLPAPSIDTGAGLERLTSVVQQVSSNYDTDLFTPLLQRVSELSGIAYGNNSKLDTSMRVIADHARTVCFLVADGVFPDKTSREYVLRRIFRRAVRHGKLLGIQDLFMPSMCETVVQHMQTAFPDLTTRQQIIHKVATEEETRFRATLDRGISLLEEEFARPSNAKTKSLSGNTVFQLYDTFGFPADLTAIIAEERGFSIDTTGFEKALAEAKQRSRFVGSTGVTDIGVYKEWLDKHSSLPQTQFVGYQANTVESAEIVALLVSGEPVPTSLSPTQQKATAGAELAIVLDTTPFYAESGGQVGDIGFLTSLDGNTKICIENTIKPDGNTHVHIGKVLQGTASIGQTFRCDIDSVYRGKLRIHHSATHLLHKALQVFLGDHVTQKGSLVTTDKLRFDFSHFAPLTAPEKKQIESWVNQQILANQKATTEELPIAQAQSRGAKAMFGEKYGDIVRVVGIGSDSLEFCGGTHIGQTGDIGLCKLISEQGIAQGVRRIEAVAGEAALSYIEDIQDCLNNSSKSLRVSPSDIPKRIEQLQEELRNQEKLIASLRAKIASGGGKDLMGEVQEVCGVKFLGTTIAVTDSKTLRDTAEKLRSKLRSGIVVLAGVDGQKVSLVAMVTKDVTPAIHAGQLLQQVATVLDGKAGGRPDMAQGGGKNPSKVEAALERARQWIDETLSK